MLHLLGGIEEVVLTRRLPACDGSQGFKVMSSQLLAKHHTVSWLAFVAKTTSWPLKIENRSSGDHVGFFFVWPRSIMSSIASLFWTIVLLLLLFYSFGVLLTQLVRLGCKSARRV